MPEEPPDWPVDDPIDVVIPLGGKGSPCDDLELRYCLRSIEKNLVGLGRIWLVAGAKPHWLLDDGDNLIYRNVLDICPVADISIFHKILMACVEAGGFPKLSDKFLFFSDDQILLRRLAWPQFGPFHHGNLRRLAANEGGWWNRLRYTCGYLAGKGKPTLYGDTHTPIPMLREQVFRISREVDWRSQPGFCVGTLYLNWSGARARPLEKRKAVVSRPKNLRELTAELNDKWFLVHTDPGFTEGLRRLLYMAFPDRSRFEKEEHHERLLPAADPQIKEKITAFIETIRPYPKERFHGNGIVTCAGGRRLHANAYVMLRLLRQQGCELPIECWYDGLTEKDAAWERLVRRLRVKCVDARGRGFEGLPFGLSTRYADGDGNRGFRQGAVNGYAMKAFALLNSSFRRALFLDADNATFCDPTFLLAQLDDAEPVWLWPDLGCPFKPLYHGFGLPPKLDEGHETGQLLCDKARAWRALVLANWFCLHSDYFFRFSYGDKEMLWAACQWTDTASKTMRPPTRSEPRGGFVHYTPEGEPIFLHRVGPSKWNPDGRTPKSPQFPWQQDAERLLSERSVLYAILASAQQHQGSVLRPLRNLVYHIYPNAENEEWRTNITELLSRWEVFTGRKLIGVATDAGTLATEDVKALFPDDQAIEWLAVQNDPVKGELLTFGWALELLSRTDGSGTTFYAHTKGAGGSHRGSPTEMESIRRWRRYMYHCLLDFSEVIDRVLVSSPCCGTFRSPGECYPAPGDRPSTWHFAGSFFWFSNSLLGRPGALDLGSNQFAVERYLGSIAGASEAVCIGLEAPEGTTLYHLEADHWDRMDSIAESVLGEAARLELTELDKLTPEW